MSIEISDENFNSSYVHHRSPQIRYTLFCIIALEEQFQMTI
jgi:hypothetical protein